MAKVRVYELAKELGIESKTLLMLLKGQGEFVRSASSTLAPPVVRRIRQSAATLFPDAPSGHAQPGTTVIDQLEDGRSAPVTPASLISGWRAGAVPPPKDPDLLANIERLKGRFPEFETHARLLSQLGSQVVYAGMCKVSGFNGCGVALVRFSNAIESAFGLTREVMLFYSPYIDLQVRTLQAAKSVPKTLGKDITPDLVFISSPDARLRERLDDWTKGGSFLAIPLEVDAFESPIDFISLIRDYIYSRDLFYETTPVQRDRFFGRRVLLQALRDDARAQRVAGLFGLRKAGKTSVLLQLANDLEDFGALSVLVDLESFPSPPHDPIPDLLASLRQKLIDALKRRGLRTKELSECSPAPSISELKSALHAVLRKLQGNATLPMVVVMLDEIEYLTPSEKVDVAEGDMPQIAQFLGAMRSLVQETDNFTFILSGLTSQIVESGRLYGRPNPLFSWAKAHYVSPFSRDEANELARTVGSRMGIEMEEGALEALFEATGGHAYLYRSLASAVVTSLSVDVFRRRMTRAVVLRSLEDWRLSVVGNLEEMVQHVKRYYPTEGLLLDFLFEDADVFPSVARSEPKALRHLMDLGLVERDGDRYVVNTVLELL